MTKVMEPKKEPYIFNENLGRMVKAWGKSIMKFVSRTGPVGLLIWAFKTLGDIILGTNKRIVNLAKGLGIGYDRAKALYGSIVDMATSSGELYFNIERAVEAQLKFRQALRINYNLAADELKSFLRMTERVGLSDEVASKFVLLSKTLGSAADTEFGNVHELTESLRASGETTLSFKTLMEDLGDVSGFTLLHLSQFGDGTEKARENFASTRKDAQGVSRTMFGTVTNLARAAHQAKKMGISLEQMTSLGDSLFDYEKVLEVTSKIAAIDPTTNFDMMPAVLAATTGDMGKAARLMLEQVRELPKYLLKNRFLISETIGALGLGPDVISDIIVKSEQWQKLTEDQRARYDAVSRYAVDSLEDQKRVIDSLTEGGSKYLEDLNLGESGQKRLIKLAESTRSRLEEGGEAADEAYTRFRRQLALMTGTSEHLASEFEGNVTFVDAFQEAVDKLKDSLVALNRGDLIGKLTGILIDLVDGIYSAGGLRNYLTGGADKTRVSQYALEDRISDNLEATLKKVSADEYGKDKSDEELAKELVKLRDESSIFRTLKEGGDAVSLSNVANAMEAAQKKAGSVPLWGEDVMGLSKSLKDVGDQRSRDLAPTRGWDGVKKFFASPQGWGSLIIKANEKAEEGIIKSLDAFLDKKMERDTPDKIEFEDIETTFGIKKGDNIKKIERKMADFFEGQNLLRNPESEIFDETVHNLADSLEDLGEAVVETTKKMNSAKVTDQPASEVTDFILRPGRAPIKFDKGDIIMGGTKLLSGGASVSGPSEASKAVDSGLTKRVESLLERLVVAVESGSEIKLDGYKVGEAVHLSKRVLGYS